MDKKGIHHFLKHEIYFHLVWSIFQMDVYKVSMNGIIDIGPVPFEKVNQFLDFLLTLHVTKSESMALRTLLI